MPPTSVPAETATAEDVLYGRDPLDQPGNVTRLVDAGWEHGAALRAVIEWTAPRKAEAEAVHRERTTRNARAAVDREEAEAAMRLPPPREDYTLASYRAENRPPKVERVEQLQRAGHRTALVASYKTGKTTLHADLTRALVDGGKFLGRFAVKPPQGRVGVWNAEMDSEDYEAYLVDAGVTWLPLLSDAGADAAVAWLKRNDVGYWIIDPWARLCAWSGVDENVNAEVGPLLQRVDEVADAAGVGEVLVVHHAGHARGRPRGATVFPDWADGIWLYGRDEDGDEERYLRVEGRGVALDEGLVELEAGRLTFREVGRRVAKMDRLAVEVAKIVSDHPSGVSTSEVQNAITGSNALKVNAVRKAGELGLIRQESDPDDRRRKLLFPPDGLGV